MYLHTKLKVNISQSSTKIWGKVGFVYMMQLVGHLESDLDPSNGGFFFPFNGGFLLVNKLEIPLLVLEIF